nr:MAG TPA: hypothetical protein [Caudoviricetes sp.]
MRKHIILRNFAADYPIFNNFTIPALFLRGRYIRYRYSLVIKALRNFPQFK